MKTEPTGKASDPPAGVAHAPSPRRNLVESALPAPSLVVGTIVDEQSSIQDIYQPAVAIAVQVVPASVLM